MKKSYAILTNLHYTKDHEWLDVKTGKVGITDFAQAQVSKILSIEFSIPIGKKVNAHQTLATLKSAEAAWEIHSPVAGVLAEVNQALLKNIALANQAPYKEGWIFRIEPTHLDLGKLLDAEAYLEITEG